ncbi:MAG: M20/M25/M40 family metallo-hydrolase [Terriglobia bacterium]|nr:M20/M25/M40 family metallo-hydrolase [Terriglobia bacterium]
MLTDRRTILSTRMPIFTRSNPEPPRDDRSAPDQQIARLAELRLVHETMAWFRRNEHRIAEWQLAVTAIPAAPFGEEQRSRWMRDRFEEIGLLEVHRDELGNVFGTRPGTDPETKFLAISAHMDTVFPAGTPLDVRREGERLRGPGICDNGAGLVALLALAAALHETGIQHRHPIVFIGNVGEEGEGDLRGMRHIFSQQRWRESIERVLVLDGAGIDSIIAEGLGSRRFEVTVEGPGGHSWSDFGVPNPIVALGRAIEHFSRTPLPDSPKTTFNIGVISGGTSVNSIPQSAFMRVDLRSSAAEEIDRLESALRAAIEDAVEETRATVRGRAPLRYEIRMVGNRPSADLPANSPLMQTVRAVDAHLGIRAKVNRASTDANIPLSLGIEALAIGGGGSGGGAHTLHEWFEPAARDLALKRILLTTLALTGVPE